MQHHDEEIVVAAFFPPQSFSSLQSDQPIILEFDAMGDRFTESILAVEPQAMSPDAIQKRFELSTAQMITQPATVAIVQFEPASKTSPSAYLGSVGHAQVEVGSQRLIALLPLVGQFFDKTNSNLGLFNLDRAEQR